MQYTDLDYMARAIRLAEQGGFTTDPNPRVACVLVKDEKLLQKVGIKKQDKIMLKL